MYHSSISRFTFDSRFFELNTAQFYFLFRYTSYNFLIE